MTDDRMDEKKKPTCHQPSLPGLSLPNRHISSWLAVRLVTRDTDGGGKYESSAQSGGDKNLINFLWKSFPFFFCYYIVQSAYNESSMSSLIWERRKICSPNRRRHSLSVASLHHLCHPPAGKKIILSPPVTAGWTGWGSAPLWPPVQAVVCVPNDATVLIRCVSYKQSVSSTPPVSERWKKPTAYLIQTQTGAAASDQMSIKEKVKINFFFSLVCCYWLAFNRSIDAARIKVGASRKFPKQMYTLDISREAPFEKVMFVLNYIYRSWRSPVRRVPVDPQQSRLYGHLAPLSQVHCCWKTGGKSLPKRKEATVSRRWQEEKLKLK